MPRISRRTFREIDRASLIKAAEIAREQAQAQEPKETPAQRFSRIDRASLIAAGRVHTKGPFNLTRSLQRQGEIKELLKGPMPTPEKIRLETEQAELDRTLSDIASTAIKLAGEKAATKVPATTARVTASTPVKEIPRLKGGWTPGHEAEGWEKEKSYQANLRRYGRELNTRNNRVTELNKQAGRLRSEGKKLPFKVIADHNAVVTALNARVERLQAASHGVDLTSSASVDAYNAQVNQINLEIRRLAPQRVAADRALAQIDQHNARVTQFQSKVDKLPPLPKAPPRPQGTLTGYVYQALDTAKKDWRKATRADLKLHQKVGGAGLLIAEYVIPGVWARNIKGMTNAQIAGNLALDLLVLIPVARTLTAMARGGTKVTGKAALKIIAKAELKASKANRLAVIKVFGKSAAVSYKNVIKLQRKYIKDLGKLKTIKGRAGTSKAAVIKQTQTIEVTEKALTDAAQQFVRVTKLATKRARHRPALARRTAHLLADPKIAEALNKIPRIADYTKNLVDAVYSPGTSKTLKTLQSELRMAQSTLDTAKQKWPTDPGKWSDFVFDVIVKETQIQNLKQVSLDALHQAIIHSRAKIKRLKSIAKNDPIPGRRAKAASDLKRETLKLEKLKADLTDAIFVGMAKATRGGETEGIRRGGGVGLTIQSSPRAVRGLPKPTVISRGGGIARTGAAALTASTIKVTSRPVSAEAVQTITKGITSPEVIKAVETELARAIRTATHIIEETKVKEATAGKTSTAHDTKTRIKDEIKSQIKARIKAAPHAKVGEVLKTKVAEITDLAIKTATLLKLKTPTKLMLQLKKTPPLPRKWGGPIVTVEQVIGKPKTDPGIVDWRQGRVQVYIDPPYREGIEDVSYKPSKPGGGTPQQTIRTRLGKPPQEIHLGMGVVKATIHQGRNIKFRKRRVRQHIKL